MTHLGVVLKFVSILVLLDSCAKTVTVHLRLSAQKGFQSLFCWIHVLRQYVDDAMEEACFRFQSLFCWIHVLRLVALAILKPPKKVFQSLFCWIHVLRPGRR